MVRIDSGRILVVALGLLCVGTVTSAATRYVATGGSCSNHAAVGSDFVSCANSIAAKCTEAKPCCEFQDGMNAANASDTIEAHHGTYQDNAGWTETMGQYVCTGCSFRSR